MYESLLSLFFYPIPNKTRLAYSLSITKLATTVKSNISSTNKTTELSAEELQSGCRLGLDSHADISCAGRHARITATYHGQVCNVSPFNDSYKPMTNIHTVDTAYAVDTSDGKTYILNVNQSLDFTDSMTHSLVCTNQARMNNVIIDDIPTTLDLNGRSTHSVYFPDQDIRIPLQLHGPISYLPVRYPTDEELEFCPTLDLTSHDEWDPSCVELLEQGSSNISSIHIEFEDKVFDHAIFRDMPQLLVNKINISGTSRTKNLELTPETLAANWNISISDAKSTLQATTQNSVAIRQGHIHRRVKTTPHHLRYRHLTGYLGMFCSDTFNAKVKSLRGNTYTQLFCNRGNFTRCYSMKHKSDAHHALDTFIHEVGIPEEMLTDNAKELHLGEWGKTCRRRRIRQLTTEPHSPWQNTQN